MDIRSSSKIFHGRGRTRQGSGHRRSGRRGVKSAPEDHLHHWQMADHEFARALQRSTGRQFSTRPIPRRSDQERQFAAVDYRMDHARRRHIDQESDE